MIHKVTQLDDQISHDRIGCDDISWSDFPTADKSKPEIGRVIITNLKTGEQTKINNMVVLGGREVLAQKLINIGEEKSYQLRYFQVGDGGCTVSTTPSKIGPYDDDQTLKNIVPFSSGNNIDNGTYKYIHNGASKLIKSDGGKIEIITEKHTIDTLDNSGNQIQKDIDAKTSIKFTLFVNPDECYSVDENGEIPQTRIFRFNEAALLLVDMDEENTEIPAGESDNAKFNANYKLFARFTTLNKYLEANDGLKIEWYILV